MAHQPLDPFAAPQAQAAYFKAIADGVDLPLVAYVRSDAMSLTDILGVANHPNVAGVKFATTNLMLLAECIRSSTASTGPVGLRPRRRLGCAVLRRRRARLHLGPRQCRSRPLAGDPCGAGIGHFDRVRDLVATIATFETMRTRFGNGANVTVVKEAMEMIGFPVGPVRLPGLPALDDQDRARLSDVLRGWGLLPSRAAAE